MLKNFLTIILLNLTVMTSLYADEELDALFAMSIEELLQVEVEGSTKTEQSILTVPASVTVFKHEEIKRLGASNLNELMNYVSGFQSRRTGAGSVIYSSTTRGHTSGTSSRDILILIDGQRVNNDYNAGSGGEYPFIPLENVKKVEFIKGAGSSLYGSNAFSAVINITTLRDVNELTVRLSSHSALGSALVSTSDNDIKFSGFIKAVKDKGIDYSNLTDTIGNGQTTTTDSYDSIDLYLQTHYKDLSIYLSHSKKHNENFYILRRLSDDNYRKTEQTHLRLTYDVDISENLHSKIALSYLYFNDVLGVALTVAPTIPPFADAKFEEGTPSLEWFNSYQINNIHNIQFGAELRRPKQITSTVTYTNIPTLPAGKESAREIYGIYAQYQGTVLDNLHLTLGARYDYYSDFGGSFNPRAALVYDGVEDTSFKLLYSSAFRAPSRNELDLINNGVLLGNPDLEPETLDNFEVITIKQFQEHSISLSYYVNMIDDIIVNVSQPSGAILRENAANGVFRGLELEYIGSPLEYLQIRASYSHILSKPNFAFRSSDDIVSSILNYNRDSYNINLSGYYHSSTQNDDAGTLTKVPSYTLVDTKWTYHLDERASVFFQMKNIFDKDYFSPSEGSSLTINVPNRGRETFGGLEITF